MIKVLLLGDSIRMHYQDEVIKNLGDNYQVFKPEENCRFSRYTLNSLRFWLAECSNPDIIHWNNGLWDTSIVYEEDGCFTPIDEYVRDMKKILRVLKKTGAKVIFATTTPVNPLKANCTIAKHFNEDVINYNNKLVSEIKDDVDKINDLFNFVYPKIDEYISEDYVHPTIDGKVALGKIVADTIRSL